MTDSRLPGRWLLDPTMDGLSDRAWRTFTGSLMWSNEAGTDGRIPKRALRMLHPEGVDDETSLELISVGLWAESAEGVEIVDWEGQGQELAEVIEAKRAQARERQRAFRAKEKEKQEKAEAKATAPPVADDVARDVARDVGQERTGQERTGQALDQGGESVRNAVSDWDAAVPGPDGPEVDGKCVGCGWAVRGSRCDKVHTEAEQARINAVEWAAA